MKTSKQRRATRGSGCWQRTETGWRYRIRIELPDGTKKTKSFSGKTQNACRHAAEDFKKSLLSSIDAQAMRTLDEWGEIWLESKRGAVCYGTYHNYDMYFHEHIVPALGRLPVIKIKPIQIELFLAQKANLSPSARKAIRGVLVQIYKMLVKNNIVTRNPMDGIAAPTGSDPDIRTFGLDDIQKIIAHTVENPNGFPILGMLYTGCRFEEIAALMWNDIGTETITIQRAVVRKDTTAGKPGGWEIRERTKSGHSRIVGINPNMQELLATLPRKSIYVFPRDNGRFMTYDWYYGRYKSFLQECGVPYLPMHKCRHTYATYLLKGSHDFRIVQQALGHSDPCVTMRYTHPDEQDQIAAAAKLTY